MAQKTEKEDTDFKVSETLTLCINNCGLIGNPSTSNMCQNCFSATTTTTATSSSASVTGIMKFSAEKIPRSGLSRSNLTPDTTGDRSQNGIASDGVSVQRLVNRCSGCRRKVGLTGFRCRCGEMFCSEHRYSDRHVCSYDYKTIGRENIARENPVVRAAKIVRV